MDAIRHRQILTAYRHLYRHALKAVHFSVPARYKIREIIRPAFRNSPIEEFNPVRVANTIQFLARAREYNGIEHKILRNILFVKYWKEKQHHSPWLNPNNPLTADIRKNSWNHFTATVEMLNESQELCLKT